MLTREQAQDLVDYFGTKSAAARAVGVHHTTFYHWLDPEKGRERFREAYRRNPEAQQERTKRWYEGLSSQAYNRRLLQFRRGNAVARGRRPLAEDHSRFFPTFQLPPQQKGR